MKLAENAYQQGYAEAFAKHAGIDLGGLAARAGSQLKALPGNLAAQGGYVKKMFQDPNNKNQMMDLAGLGVLAIPAAHQALSSDESTTHRGMGALELGGLGMLAREPLQHVAHNWNGPAWRHS